MIREAIQKIEELVKLASYTIHEVDGEKFSALPLHQVVAKAPEATPLVFHTLDGFAQYALGAKQGGDRPELPDDLAVVVSSPALVFLVGPLNALNRTRERFAECMPLSTTGFGYGTYLDVESFCVALQCQFVETEDRADLLKLVGNLRDESVKTSEDDGVTQVVAARVGVARIANVAVKNPVVLAPFRTFAEVDQPASPFVFRLKRGENGGLPMCALFEADGGRWRVEAVKRIKEHLVATLEIEIPVLA